MQRFLAAAFLFASLTGSAAAQLNEPDGFSPVLMVVVGHGRVHFIKDDHGCPSAAAACVARAYLLPGNHVVALATHGDWVKVAYTGGPPRYYPSFGYLPRTALAAQPAGSAAPAAWSGKWHSDAEQEIDISQASGLRLLVDGNATWGASDPARVAAGGVNIGTFKTTLPVRGAAVTFTPADAGAAATLNPSLSKAAENYDCVIRMRLLGGPYLWVSDNANCGGANVTFTGLYRRAPTRR